MAGLLSVKWAVATATTLLATMSFYWNTEANHNIRNYDILMILHRLGKPWENRNGNTLRYVYIYIFILYIYIYIYIYIGYIYILYISIYCIYLYIVYIYILYIYLYRFKQTHTHIYIYIIYIILLLFPLPSFISTIWLTWGLNELTFFHSWGRSSWKLKMVPPQY